MKVCTTDRCQGFIAGINGATLATHCNPQRCRLYYTKPDDAVIPVEFSAALNAAVEIRELEIDGYTLTTEGFAFWRVEAHKAYMRATRTAEFEREEPEQPAHVPGDSDAFRFELLEQGEG